MITGEYSARGPRSSAIAVAVSWVMYTMMALLSLIALGNFTLALARSSLGLPGIDSSTRLFGLLLKLDAISIILL